LGKPTLLTAREVAELKGITHRQVNRLTKAGILPVYAVGPRNTALYRKGDVRYMKTSLKQG
jgi:hypothetical protein